MSRRAHRGWRLAAVLLVLGFLAGCGPSGPGLTDKPPPKGGPPRNTRKPPGEVNNPATR
ncbi:MAG TPA: hypothetical protein VKT32_02605 [Chthonomonadaceae bacterium]|nr:hypothetical protein [Chthonomonadaceae bacterium]